METRGAAGAEGEAGAEATRRPRKAAKEATTKAAKATTKAATAAKEATTRAATTVKTSAKKAATTTKAVKAAREGRVEDAREVAADAGLGEGLAADAIAGAEEMHYRVEVNKRGFNAGRLADALNEMWQNGWRLAQVFEQRGNTVLVFEKRDES